MEWKCYLKAMNCSRATEVDRGRRETDGVAGRLKVQ